MLFRPKHKHMILIGKKTATRRVWKRPMVKIGGIYKCKTKMLSKDYFAKIKVIKLFKQKLVDMYGDDFSKEGYMSYNEFKEVWEEINGKWNDKQEVYVIEFALLADS